MSLNFCDVLIWGSDLSGVIAGTLLAKRGLNVLVLDDSDESSPAPNVMTGLGSRQFKSLLGKLMIPDSKLQMLQENEVGLQVILPKHRLDIFATRSLYLKEMGREFPQEQELLTALLTEVDRLRENYLDEILTFFPILGTSGDLVNLMSNGFHWKNWGNKEKKRFLKWFQKFPDKTLLEIWGQLPQVLKTILEAQMKFLSRGLVMNPPLLQMLFFLPPEGAGSFSIRGGWKDLRKLFFDKLDYFGGMVHPLREDTVQILNKGLEINGIQMSRFNFPTRCRYVIGNTDIKELYSRLPTSFFTMFSRSRKKMSSLQPVEKQIVIQYHVAKEALPEPMKENVVLITDPLLPLEGLNYLEINFQDLGKESEEGLNVLMTVSYSLPNSSEEDVKNRLVEVDAKIEKLLPFSTLRLKRVYPALAVDKEAPSLFPEDQMEIKFREKVFYTPSLFFPPVNSPFKNLYAVGPNILDWLGMEGKILSAIKAVELVWERELKVKNQH